MLKEIASKTVHKEEGGDWWRKKKYKTEWIVPVENTDKNSQIFPRINHI